MVILSKDFKEEDYIPKILKASKKPLRLEFPKYWAERPQPIEGESLSSWMIRTALANLTTLPSLLNELSFNYSDNIPRKKQDIRINGYIDFDFELIPEVIEFFSKNTLIPIDKLIEMSLSNLYSKVDEITQKKS